MPDVGELTVVEVAAGVWAALQGSRGDVGLRIGESNSGFVADGGGLVIDTFWDLPRTRRLLAAWHDVLPGTPARCVNSHANGDHCWGNQLLAEQGTELIGHRRCAAAMEHEAEGSPKLMHMLATTEGLPPTMAAFGRELGALYDFADVVVTPPTTLVDDDVDLEIDLGGRRAVVISVGPAHTAGDVIVHLPDDGVVFTGDVLFNRCTPIGWEGTTDGWLAALDRIATLAPEVVVPGHGPLATVDDVRAVRDYFAYVRDEATEHLTAGATVVEAAAKIDLGAYAQWAEPERLIFQVARVGRELAGEPWDAPIDAIERFSMMAELTRTWAATRD